MSDRFEKIRTKYIGTFAEKQKDIQKAWDNKDVNQVHELLHKLAGSSGGYGFNELSVQAQNCMEIILKNHNYQVIEDSIQQIISTLKSIQEKN